MRASGSDAMGDLRSDVADALQRWAEWSRSGRHDRIIAEGPIYLDRVSERPDLSGPVLLWIAQAHLDLGDPDAAVSAARLAWESDPSPVSTHTLAIALNLRGDIDESMSLLELGLQVHPRATNLSLQLAMFLGNQGRVPEALDRLEEVDPADLGEPASASLYFRFLAGMYAACGRWHEAEDVLRDACSHLDDEAVRQALDELHGAWHRSERSRELVVEWTRSLHEIAPPHADVDDAIITLGAALEAPDLVTAAARRLWRALVASDPPTVRSSGIWAGAAFIAVSRLDGAAPDTSGLARICGCHPSSLSRARRRFDELLTSYDPDFRCRSFAAETNPRLDEDPRTPPPSRSGAVIRFPGS